MSTTKYFILPLLLLLIVLAIACKTTKEEPIEETKVASGPQLLFVNYKITKQEGGDEKVEVIDKIIAAGKMKVNRNKIPKEENRYFQCVQLDKNKEVLKTDFFANPLLKDIEYVGDDGQLGRKLIEVESVDLSIRIQLDPQAAYISLSKVGSPKKELSIINL